VALDLDTAQALAQYWSERDADRTAHIAALEADLVHERRQRLLDAAAHGAELRYATERLSVAEDLTNAAVARSAQQSLRAYYDEMLATSVALWVRLHDIKGGYAIREDCDRLAAAYRAWRQNRP
jgi:hypothetical protein